MKKNVNRKNETRNQWESINHQVLILLIYIALLFCQRLECSICPILDFLSQNLLFSQETYIIILRRKELGKTIKGRCEGGNLGGMKAREKQKENIYLYIQREGEGMTTKDNQQVRSMMAGYQDTGSERLKSRKGRKAIKTTIH